jgi:HlyD family secretion protein
VKRELLIVRVTEKGTLESADNRDMICKVRAGGKGFATSINWVIDDGTPVKPGQLLMILDDSALKDQEDKQSIAVKEKYGAKVKAEKEYEIQIKKNESTIAEKLTAFALSEIELDKLTGLGVDPDLLPRAAVAGILTSLAEGGTYKQELDDLNGQISLAQSVVEQNRERAMWAERMVKLSYMSAAQAQAERSKLDSSMEDLRSKQVKRALLVSHDRRQRVTDLTNKRDNARNAYDQAKLEAEALEIQKRTDKETTNSVYESEKENLDDIKRQRAECRIHAPMDILEGSLVVYFKPDRDRGSSSQSQGIIEHGAQVKEGQKMLRIPNLDKMQVNTKVHEAMVQRIRGDKRVPTRIVEFTQAGMMLNTDPYARMLATRPDIHETIRSVYTARDRSIEYRVDEKDRGQRAVVRVESIHDKQFAGHVRVVALVASQTEWYSSDSKMYQTYVTIDGELLPDGKVIPLKGEGLRPDTSAEVTISVDSVKEPVLTVPVQAILVPAETKATREIFVKTPTGYELREITVGLRNDMMAEIRSGLQEGDEVVVNPKVLLGDKDKNRTREAAESKDKNGNKDDWNYYKGGGDPTKGGPFPGGGDPTKGGPFPGGGDPTKGGGGKKKGKGGGGIPPPPIGEQ